MPSHDREARAERSTREAVPEAGASTETTRVEGDLLLERATLDPEERKELRGLLARLDAPGEKTLSSLMARLVATERRARRAEAERLMLIDALSAVPCAILVVAPGGRVRVANRRALRLLGRHPALQIEDGYLRCHDIGRRHAFDALVAETLRLPGVRQSCSLRARERTVRVVMASLHVGRPPSAHAVLAVLDEGDDLGGAVGFEGMLRVISASSLDADADEPRAGSVAVRE